MTKRDVLAFAFAGVLLLGAQNVAPVAAPSPPSEHPPRSAAIDSAFAVVLEESETAELQAARLALATTRSDDVAAFARQMIVDHDMIASEATPLLKKYSADANVLVSKPDELGFAYLKTLAPVDFDQHYALQQIGNHLTAQTAYETEARDGADPMLAAFAHKWLPTIQTHLELAVTLVKHVGGDTPFR